MLGRASKQDDLWVFGYGSLMWRPGFPYKAAVAAELTGYHRAFCVYSVYYRGTPERPGLVLGLDKGGVCRGLAFQVSASDAKAAISYLRTREQISGTYRECHVPITVHDPDPRPVMALTFVCERHHPAFARHLPLARQAQIIRAAAGPAGTNLEYALNTICHLQQMAFREPRLERLIPALGPVFQRHRNTGSTCEGKSAGCALSQQLRDLPRKAPRMRRDQRKRFVYRNRLAARFEECWSTAE